MKIYILLLILILRSTNAQWEQVSNGLFGSSISDIIITDTIVYVGTYNSGIFTSTNRGKDWTSISIGLSSTTIHDLTLIDSYLFAATDKEINFTTNNGKTWYQTNDKRVNYSNCIESINKNILSGDYTRGYGILFSSDYGITWRQINNDTCCKNVEVIKVLGNKIFTGTRNGLFYTTNTGNTWIKCFQPDNFNWISELEIDQNNMVVLSFYVDSIASRSKIFFSSDSGNNWIDIGEKIKKQLIYDIAFSNGILYASSDSSLYISYDFGKKWKKKTASKDLKYIFAKHGQIYGTTFNNELYISSNEGETWEIASNGITGLYINSISQINNKLITGSLFSNYISSNKGRNWSKINIDSSNFPITTILQCDKDNILVGIYNKGILKSTDGGNNWTTFNNGLGSFKINKLLKINEIIFAAFGDYPEEEGGIYTLNVNDSIWYFTSSDIPDKVVHTLTNIDTIIFAGTHRKGIYRTTNWGINWIEVNTGFGSGIKRFETMTVQNRKIFAGKYSDGLFTSTDLGETWNSCYQFKDETFSAFAANNDYVFAGSYNRGIYMSKDSGMTWENISSDLPNKHIISLLIYDDYLYAGTNSSGVWRLKLK